MSENKEFTFVITNPKVNESNSLWNSRITISGDVFSISYDSDSGQNIELKTNAKYKKMEFSPDMLAFKNCHIAYIDDHSKDHNYIKRSDFTSGNIRDEVYYQWHDDLDQLHVTIVFDL